MIDPAPSCVTNASGFAIGSSGARTHRGYLMRNAARGRGHEATLRKSDHPPCFLGQDGKRCRKWAVMSKR